MLAFANNDIPRYTKSIAKNTQRRRKNNDKPAFKLSAPAKVPEFAEATKLFENQALDAALGMEVKALIDTLLQDLGNKYLKQDKFTRVIHQLSQLVNAVHRGKQAEATHILYQTKLSYSKVPWTLADSTMLWLMITAIALALATVATAVIIAAYGVAISGFLAVTPVGVCTVLGLLNPKPMLGAAIGLLVGSVLSAALITGFLWASIPLAALVIPFAIAGLVSIITPIALYAKPPEIEKMYVKKVNQKADAIRKNMACFFYCKEAKESPAMTKLATTPWEPAYVTP